MSVPDTIEADRTAIAAVAGKLPIFPLPEAVLLPGALLPLHVFEPRYRELIADVIDPRGARVLAVALLEPGYERAYQGRPPVRPIAGAGVVARHEQLPDGRYHLVLRGAARVRIDEELPPARSYREVRAHVFLDKEPPASAAREVESLVQSLRMLGDRLIRHARRDLRDGLGEIVHQPRPPGPLADIVAAVLLADPAVRQAILEETSVLPRLRLVVDEVGKRLAGLAADSPPN